MGRKSAVTLVVSAVLMLSACGGQETEAEREARLQQAQRDSVIMADSMYDAAIFDTLTWETDEARLERGGVVWRTSCQKCHGAHGEGDGELAQQFDLTVPPFDPDTLDIAAIRHGIFVGHEGAMPNWGLHGLKYRDIDAAAAFMLTELKPETE